MESTSFELLHSIQLDMLVKFDKLCSDNNLVYFLDSGTAIGAVRHMGFIPWDDDIDVAMPRKDYNRLLEISASALPENLYLQTYETDPNYMYPFGKIRLGRSFFPDIEVEKLKFQGIYIDIFPYDKVPANATLAAMRIKISRLLWFISVFSRRHYPGKNLVLRAASTFAHRLSVEGTRRLFRFYDRFCAKYNSRSTEKWTCYCWNMSQHNVYLFDQSELFPTNSTLFEGKELKVVHDTDSYLTKMYGDYHSLPPEEKRKSHLKGRVFILDCD
ncbi:lipopolysaccharide cholinephosphotransferase [Bacteroidales bacterium WCE2004]|nr:lipopolysaccharide cholinephosphotransferase [Bacteroidales bacterium WCE2004]